MHPNNQTNRNIDFNLGEENSLRFMKTIKPERRWWRALSRALGRPVGAREARFWRGDVEEREDGRPAVDLLDEDPEISPLRAAAVYRAAEEHDLWHNGYGSPYSVPAPIIRRWLRKKLPLDALLPCWWIGMPHKSVGKSGRHMGQNPVRRLRTYKAVCRLVSEMRQDEEQQSSTFLLGRVEKLADRFGYKGFLAAIAAAAQAKIEKEERWGQSINRSEKEGNCAECGLKSFYLREDIDSLLYCAECRMIKIKREIRIKFWKNFQDLMKLSVRELRHRYASPKKIWASYGIKVAYNVTTKPSANASGKVLKAVTESVRTDSSEQLEYVSRIEAHFGHHWRQYLGVRAVKTPCGEKYNTYEISVHDVGVVLPSVRDGLGLREWIQRNAKWVFANKSSAMKIFQAWMTEYSEWPPRQIVEDIKTRKYVNLSHRLGELACDVGLPRKYASIFAAWALKIEKNLPPVECIPPVKVDSGEYTLESLERGDPRGPWLGIATDCCQHPKGEGASCAKHGALDPSGGFWVVRENGRIVAQSWVWRRKGVVVIDSVEALGNRASLKGLYLAAAKSIKGRLGIESIHAGTGSGMSGSWSLPEVKKPTKCPSSYSDADEQVILEGATTAL